MTCDFEGSVVNRADPSPMLTLSDRCRTWEALTGAIIRSAEGLTGDGIDTDADHDRDSVRPSVRTVR